MVAWDNGDTSPEGGIAPDIFDGSGVSEQTKDCKFSEGKDNFWANGFKLFEQKGLTKFDFLRKGVSVSGWVAFDDIGDIDILAKQLDGEDHFVEKFSGIADEGFCAQVFFGTWGFADEDDGSFHTANAEDHVSTHIGQTTQVTMREGLGHVDEFFFAGFQGQGNGC